MCERLSFLVFRVGFRIEQSEHTDNHTPLILRAGLTDSNESALRADWCKCELRPPEDTSLVADYPAWRLECDQSRPDWWDDAKIREAFEPYWHAMLLETECPIKLGGKWIIAKGGRIAQLVHGIVAAVHPEANLSGVDWISVDGSRSTLSRANLVGANLDGANLDGANLDGANLDGANLDGANLSRANLYRATLSRANLYRANLSRANLVGANLDGANLSRANLVGANLVGAFNWPSSKPLPEGLEIQNGIVRRK